MVIARSLPTEPDMLVVELAALFHDLAGTPVADIGHSRGACPEARYLWRPGQGVQQS
jgi:HD superfamily phosphodiesterase